MQYRKFGGNGWFVSVLGLGAMRLPTVDGQNARIDEAAATDMVRHAIDQGVNYIDTAYVYHGGNSESFLGNALKEGYRERVKLATKLPPWKLESAEDFDRILEAQLKRLQTDFIDCYLLHGMNDVQWPKLKALGVLDWLAKVKKTGLVHHLGFSFHAHLELFKEIVDAWDEWELCQIQYNYMDVAFQAGQEGLRYAADKGLGVVIMEPLRGGQLVNNLSQPVLDLWNQTEEKRTPADWALQWLWNQPEVSVVLSGMSNMDQLTANLKSAQNARVGVFSDEELKTVEAVRREYEKSTPIPCTGCYYCQPCPSDVAIPEIFQRYNDAARYQDNQRSRNYYRLMLASRQADRCQECFECEEQCPQQIPIVEWLKTCHQSLGS